MVAVTCSIGASLLTTNSAKPEPRPADSHSVALARSARRATVGSEASRRPISSTGTMSSTVRSCIGRALASVFSSCTSWMERASTKWVAPAWQVVVRDRAQVGQHHAVLVRAGWAAGVGPCQPVEVECGAWCVGSVERVRQIGSKGGLTNTENASDQHGLDVRRHRANRTPLPYASSCLNSQPLSRPESRCRREDLARLLAKVSPSFCAVRSVSPIGARWPRGPAGTVATVKFVLLHRPDQPTDLTGYVCVARASWCGRLNSARLEVMSGFVIVHGGLGGGWEWTPVAHLLREWGHVVFTPTLTGMGERIHLGPDIGLGTHVEDVVRVLEFEDLHDVVLCGASYGGMAITGAADRVPIRIRMLIYVDALLPVDGQSAADLLPEGFAEMLGVAADERGNGWVSIPKGILPPAGSIPEQDRARYIAGARNRADVAARGVRAAPRTRTDAGIGTTRPQGQGQHPLGSGHHSGTRRDHGHDPRPRAGVDRGEGAEGRRHQHLHVSVPSIVIFAGLAIVFSVVAAWIPARKQPRPESCKQSRQPESCSPSPSATSPSGSGASTTYADK